MNLSENRIAVSIYLVYIYTYKDNTHTHAHTHIHIHTHKHTRIHIYIVIVSKLDDLEEHFSKCTSPLLYNIVELKHMTSTP